TRVPVHNVLFPAPGSVPNAGYSPRQPDGSLVPLEMLTPQGYFRGDPQSLGWPRILNDLDTLVASRPNPAYDPTRLYNSGRLGEPDESKRRAWSLTFSTPGTFTYVCTVHVPVGMIAHITVEPR